MKGPKVDSFGGINGAVNQNRKIINKFNLNTENSGLRSFSHNLPHSSCGGQFGDGTVEKCKSIVTSLYPTPMKESMANMQKNVENWKTLNLKYFSADKKTTVGVRRRNLITEEDEKNDKSYGKLIGCYPTWEVDREAAVICHCGNHCRSNVRTNVESRENKEKWKNYACEERKGNRHYFLENGVVSDKRGKVHKLLAVPYKNYFFKENRNCSADRREICDECCWQKEDLTVNVLHKLLNIHAFEETGSDYLYEPYVLIPKHIYCLNQQSRKRRSDEEDPYYKTPPIDVSVETSPTNLKDQLKDEDLINELRRRKLEFPEMDGHKMEIMDKQEKVDAEVKPQQDTISEPSDSADERLKVLPGDVIQNSDMPFDKDDKNKSSKFVQEIKYYEGSLNIFGGEDKKESPFFKITKTVTFENERGEKPSDKTLGIDSWMQTDCDYDSEKESNFSYGSDRSSNKGSPGLVPSSNDSFVETAKVCGECLKLLASKYGSERIMQGTIGNPEPGKLQDLRLDKSTSIEERGQNVMGMELIRNDFVRFIAELFLEAVPKEIYNRIMGGSERLNNEEYEVRVKSYDRGSTESCNLKTCKMRNVEGKSDLRPLKGIGNAERQGGTLRSVCTCSNPMCDPNNGQRKKPSPNADERRSNGAAKSTLETSKKEHEDTYDCQITLNGRKILVKVNKSVEDLLLSGNIHNELRVSPNESFNSPNLKKRQSVPPEQEGKIRDSGKTKVAGNCTCADELMNDISKESASGKSGANKEKGFGTQRISAYGGVRKGDSFTAIEMGNYQKKAGNDSVLSGRNAKPLVTSPPAYGSDAKKPDKSRNQERNVAFNNTKSLYWSNVEVFDKANEESNRVLKAKKLKSSDYDSSQNKMRGRAENPIKVFASRRQGCLQEKAKRHGGSVSGKQADECFPLYWESQYLKYCDQIVSEDGGCPEKTDSCKGNMRDGKACNFVHDIEKRVMVTPTYGHCNAIDAPRPFCIIKIADSENCESSQYRDYTVANVTSVKLNSNPFNGGSITCRKCIETLRSCSKQMDSNWTDDKRFGNYRDVDLCNYYWNGKTGRRSGDSVYSEGVKDDNRSTTKSETILRNNEYYDMVPVRSGTPHGSTYWETPDSCCCLNGQFHPSKESITWNSDEKLFLRADPGHSKVSSRKLHGICFRVSRITHRQVPDVDSATHAAREDHPSEPKSKHIGVSTSNRNSKKWKIPMETKTFFTQTTENSDGDERKMTAENQRSRVCFSASGRGRKSSQTQESSVSDSGDGTKAMTLATAVSGESEEDKKEMAQSQVVKSDVNIEVLLKNETINPSEDSVEMRNGRMEENPRARQRFRFKKSWRWWWWKKKGSTKR